jgi:ABC-type Zn uptake system ZnuABC Zn-binding protein ZnuA
LGLIKANNVKVIEVTSYYDDKIPMLLSQQTGAKVAKVAGDVGGTPEASDYFAYINSLIKAFAQ